MAARTKTVRRGFGYRQCDDFAAYLNHMARQGWHFKEWRAGLVFEQGEPRDSAYAVEIFTKAEEDDTRPLPETKEFAEYCEAAGWEFVDAWRKFVVFRRVREDAVPIMTDEERFQNTVKAENIFVWYPLGHSAIGCAMELFEFSSMFPYRIFSSYHVILLAVWIGLFLITGLRAVHFLLWKRQCRQRIDQRLSLFLGRSQVDKWCECMYLLIILLDALSMFLIGEPIFGLVSLAVAAALVLMGYVIAKLRPDSSTSGLIQLLGTIAIFIGVCFAAFYFDQARNAQEQDLLEPPLTYTDMGIDLGEPEIHYSKEQKSVFGLKQYANLDYGDDYLFYSIYTTDVEWVLDKLWEEETDGKANETREYCTDAWGAVVAFRNGAGNYIVRYDDALWVISPSLEEPLTSEQIELAIAAIRGD